MVDAMEPLSVLVVEDDEKIATSVARGLRAEGMAVEVVTDGMDGRDRALAGGFDVIVLDIMLPGRNGYQICADVREAGDATPILMLTAKDGEYDEAEALDTGADDYVTKPFSFVVLTARIRALARRRGTVAGGTRAVAGLRIDGAARRVWKSDEEVELTAREFDVLAHLADHAGQVLSKSQLVDAVWGHAHDGDPNVVEVYVSRLRRRLGEEVVRTVRGVGYQLGGGRR